jgi:hypothetical protein
VREDTTHRAKTGLGHIGSDKSLRGVLVHTALAVGRDRVPLGVIGQKCWAQEDADFAKVKVVGTRRIQLERGNRLEAIDLQVKVYAAQVHRPKHFGSGSGLADTIPIWGVEAQEVDKGQAQLIRWTLLCTERTESASDALRRLDDDVLRWRVERFHDMLKQGLKVERLQFDDARTLMNAVSA